MVDLDCPRCLESFPIADGRQGSAARCPKCQTLVRLPGKRPPAAAPAPPPRGRPAARVPSKARPNNIDDVEVAEFVRKPKRAKKRRSTSGSFEMPDWLVPLGLFGGATAMNALIALRGGDAGKGFLVVSLIQLVLTVPATIGGMFVAAAALGINFGGVFLAALKVAAITAVVQVIYAVGQLGGGDGSAVIVLLFAFPVYWGLFCWLFDLTFVEALQATFFIGLIQKAVNVAVTLLVAGIVLKAAANAP